MKIKKIAIKSNSLLEQTLLPLLIGRVFHVTNKKSFEKIKKSNLINPNAQNKYTYNFPQSAQNFGSRNNMVCLIDLRQKDFNTSLNLSGGGYYFLHPKNEWTEVIFLFLESNFYKDLKLQARFNLPLAGENYISMKKICKGEYVPEIECWYPGGINLQKISDVIIVNIDDPDNVDNKISHYLS